MKIAVFWEPPEPVYSIIATQKERCRRYYPEATYRAHPVHSTLFLAEIPADRRADARDALQHAAATPSPVMTGTAGWFVFENDLATGGDTVTIAFTLTPALKHLQRAVADALAPLRAPSAPAELGATEADGTAAIQWRGPFAESMERYGFPFVGDHWIPHTTVASLPGGAALIQEIVATPVTDLTLPVDRLGLWEINGEAHTRIAVIPVAPETTKEV